MSEAGVIRVWDWPVRLTHWGFALFIPLSWWTAENSLWAWHERSGIALLGLLLFRLIWGVIGTRTARFAAFVKGPGAVLAHLRGKGGAIVGHNPLGALSVVALLAAIAAQVGMGLFAGDPYDGLTGPLNPLVGVSTADAITDWHESFYWVLGGLVALHLGAIAFYAIVRRANLVGPMVTGRKQTEPGVEGIAAPSPLAAFGALAVAAALTIWIALGAPPLT
jgi:cytochrome b